MLMKSWIECTDWKQFSGTNNFSLAYFVFKCDWSVYVQVAQISAQFARGNPSGQRNNLYKFTDYATHSF